MAAPKSDDHADRRKTAAEAKRALLEKFKAAKKAEKPSVPDESGARAKA